MRFKKYRDVGCTSNLCWCSTPLVSSTQTKGYHALAQPARHPELSHALVTHLMIMPVVRSVYLPVVFSDIFTLDQLQAVHTKVWAVSCLHHACVSTRCCRSQCWEMPCYCSAENTSSIPCPSVFLGGMDGLHLVLQHQTRDNIAFALDFYLLSVVRVGWQGMHAEGLRWRRDPQHLELTRLLCSATPCSAHCSVRPAALDGALPPWRCDWSASG